MKLAPCPARAIPMPDFVTGPQFAIAGHTDFRVPLFGPVIKSPIVAPVSVTMPVSVFSSFGRDSSPNDDANNSCRFAIMMFVSCLNAGRRNGDEDKCNHNK